MRFETATILYDIDPVSVNAFVSAQYFLSKNDQIKCTHGRKKVRKLVSPSVATASVGMSRDEWGANISPNQSQVEEEVDVTGRIQNIPCPDRRKYSAEEQTQHTTATKNSVL